MQIRMPIGRLAETHFPPLAIDITLSSVFGTFIGTPRAMESLTRASVCMRSTICLQPQRLFEQTRTPCGFAEIRFTEVHPNQE